MINGNDPLGVAHPVHPDDAFKPTEGQEKAINGLYEKIIDPMTTMYKALLEGWAGTGKTWTINRLVEKVKAHNPRINFGMTAPTHKAVRQLRKHSELKDQLDFGTIHSFLGLKEVLKDDPKDPHKKITTYELDWESKKERRIDTVDVLVIDESSMLGSVLYGYIDDVARSRTDLKIIFMGDSLQIPPVKEKDATGAADAIPFIPEQRYSRRIEHFVLTEVVRQKGGNPIIEYSAAIRDQHKFQSINWKVPEVQDENSGVEIRRKEDGIQPLRDLFMKYFDTTDFQIDPDYVKVIAWRNTTVDYFNREIRLLLNRAETLPKIIENEKLILDKPVLRGDKILLPNNEELDVLKCSVEDLPYQYKFIDPSAFAAMANTERTDPSKGFRDVMFKVYKTKVRATDGRDYDLNILHEDSEQQYNQVRDILSSTATKLRRQGQHFEGTDMWKEFYKIEKQFAWVKYNYCLTAHKAQGSTYDYCISMEWDIEQNRDIPERNRIRYVAATRARNKLFIVK